MVALGRWGLGAGFAVVLGVELGACWCGDDVSAGFVRVFGDGPAVCVEQCVVWFAKRNQIVEICWSTVLGFFDVMQVYPVVWCVASGDDTSLVSDCYGFALAGCCVTNSGSKIEWDAQRVDDECLDFGVAVEESGGAVLEADTIWCGGVDGV